ncbi:MAG: hypothetical protein AAFY26_03560 [Cyanobacteria bacterium J06638_22]
MMQFSSGFNPVSKIEVQGQKSRILLKPLMLGGASDIRAIEQLRNLGFCPDTEFKNILQGLRNLMISGAQRTSEIVKLRRVFIPNA